MTFGSLENRTASLSSSSNTPKTPTTPFITKTEKGFSAADSEWRCLAEKGALVLSALRAAATEIEAVPEGEGTRGAGARHASAASEAEGRLGRGAEVAETAGAPLAEAAATGAATAAPARTTRAVAPEAGAETTAARLAVARAGATTRRAGVYLLSPKIPRRNPKALLKLRESRSWLTEKAVRG